MKNKEKIKVVILAAGKGTRMKSDFPKVLAKVQGKPMIRYVLESVEKSGICKKPCIVVGYGKEQVMDELGKKYNYVVQEKQLGTGHAVMTTKKTLENKAENILVLYGDNPFLTGETIKKLANKHLQSGKKITMATINLPNFNGWRKVFYQSFSRVIRNKNGDIVRSVESRDANEEELKVLEVNPCYYCFDAKWMWNNLGKIKNENNQKEYYINDLLKILMEERKKIAFININPQEALAANSKEELDTLEKFV
jgi:bifunctional UDP-N-acetylglucosamine pyrophosphorylase / glucosamine-1-phosphate N-acetyltransferase